MSTSNGNIELSNFKVIFPIGSGAFSKVYRVEDKKSGEYYAAKVCNFMVDEETKDAPETRSLFREVNLMSILNHPSVLNFVGYCSHNFEGDPFPTIITEFSTNGSLGQILDSESLGLALSEWESTKKLICIFGIASGMSYLHSHEIIHRDLKPDNILMDDFLYPKISDFGLSKILDFLSVSMNVQSQRGMKGTPVYMAPEVFNNEYSKASDVYAFGIIVFQIVSLEKPFENMLLMEIFNKVCFQGYRPEIKEDVPDVYRELIEQCWSQSPDERPTFESIVEKLKTNKEFLTDNVDENEFLDYIDFIDSSQISFNKGHQLIHFEDFVKNQGRSKFLRKVNININQNNKPPQTETASEHNISSTKYEISTKEKQFKINNESNNANKSHKIKEIEDNEKVIEEYNENNNDVIKKSSEMPSFIFNKLSDENQKLVLEARNDPEKQYIVGKYLIEGDNGFPVNIHYGIEYVKESISNKNFNGTIYFIRKLIKGDVVSRSIEKAKEYLQIIENKQDEESRIYRVF